MLDNNDVVKLNEIFPDKEELWQVKKELKKDIFDFKGEILAGQDEIMTKLDKLLQEKTIGNEQDKRKTEVLEIHNVALKKNKILTPEEIEKIAQLRAF